SRKKKPLDKSLGVPNVGSKVPITFVPDADRTYIRLFTPVTCVRLKMLKPSARNSILDPSVTLKRREMRKSTYLIDGVWNVLFGVKPNRSEPFEPLMPPAWLVPNVLPVATAAGGVKPLVTAVERKPEYILTIGAIVQPFRIALAVSPNPVKLVL